MTVEAATTPDAAPAGTDVAAAFSAMGVWLVRFDATGQPAPAAEPDGRRRFWTLAWGASTRLRQQLGELATAAADRPRAARPLGCPGLVALAAPQGPRGADGAVVACAITDEFDPGEPFERWCGVHQLDATLMAGLAAAEPHLAPAQSDPLAGLLGQLVQMQSDLQRRDADLVQLSEQLGNTYEELQVIYRLGGQMRLHRTPGDYFRYAFGELGELLEMGGFAAVLEPGPRLADDDRVLIAGDGLTIEGVERLAAQITAPGIVDEPFVLNNSVRTDTDFAWAGDWLANFVALPMLRQNRLLGLLLALNRPGPDGFDSMTIQLLRHAADRGAVFLDNWQLYGNIEEMLMGLLHVLVRSIDAKDPYTCGHSERVAAISRHIAQAAGLGEEIVERAYLAGLLHDVGKIGVPESVLCKTGRLTDEEFDQMKRHPSIGARILSDIPQIKDVLDGVLYHHERPDGRGYPDGRCGNDVPVLGRIVGLADCFDAMTSTRTYRPALPVATALTEIRRFAGTQFDAEIAEAFLASDPRALIADLRHYTSGHLQAESIDWSARGEMTQA